MAAQLDEAKLQATLCVPWLYMRHGYRKKELTDLTNILHQWQPLIWVGMNTFFVYLMAAADLFEQMRMSKEI